jgi:hypothetical protein
MMVSLLRLSAITTLVPIVTGFAISAAVPSQTIGLGNPGIGYLLYPEPTTAPSFELVEKKLAKKAVTNVCSEWTISGGKCSNAPNTCTRVVNDLDKDLDNHSVMTPKHVYLPAPRGIIMKDVACKA